MKTDCGSGGGDWIHLRRVKVDCVLGVYDEERVAPRPVWFDVSVECDVRTAGRTDCFADALNYEEIEAAIVGAARGGRCRLLEALAERVAEACLGDGRVRRVRVAADKPGALPHAESVAVEIVRTRAGD